MLEKINLKLIVFKFYYSTVSVFSFLNKLFEIITYHSNNKITYDLEPIISNRVLKIATQYNKTSYKMIDANNVSFIHKSKYISNLNI
jgi:hypothetical protein